MVSTTIASVIELFGRFKLPLTYKLVVVALVIISLTKTLEVAKIFVLVILTAKILAGLKLVAPRLVKKPLVEVIDEAIKIVEVNAVPLALVNTNGPLRVPPTNGR